MPLRELGLWNYAVHFRNGLIVEREALAEEFKQYDLYDVVLEGVQGQPGIYKLNVPGLREYIPGVYVGDKIIVRAIRVLSLHAPLPPGFGGWFDGREHVVYIWYIDRFKVRNRPLFSDVF